jgi:RNA-directed DNA polymerase
MVARIPSEDLSRCLALDQSLLGEIARESEDSYYRFSLPKRSGQRRWIDAPLGPLKECQRRLLDRILYRIPIHEAAHGFVPGRSILTNARCHETQPWVIKFDIKNFFPSTTRDQVMETLQCLSKLSLSDAELIGTLLTRGGVLPQGAPTSPHMANSVFRAIDENLSALAREYGMSYTRYADDLTFSGSSIPIDLEKRVKLLVGEGGYHLAHQKTRRMGQHQRQMVTGLVVNNRARLPRPVRRRLRAIIHDIDQRGLTTALSRSPWATAEQLWGYFNFDAMVNDAARPSAMQSPQK